MLKNKQQTKKITRSKETKTKQHKQGYRKANMLEEEKLRKTKKEKNILQHVFTDR